MRRAEKEEVVAKFEDDLTDAQSIVVTNHAGIGVNQINELRSEFRSNDVHYHVVKNTLATIAVKGTEVEPVAELFKYPTAVAYSFDDAVKPAKIVRDFEEEEEAFELKGGYIAGRLLEPDEVRDLADMPSREELQRKLLGTLKKPARDLLQLLDTPAQKMVGVLQSRKDELE
ncbi:MAG: 50S ribosomal protein L10 [Bradymonadaceae bacterium]